MGPRYKKVRFANGLTILTESDRRFESVAIGFWLKVGTRHEPVSLAGISHFLEHMLFKGTPTRSAFEIARSVDAVGGEFNAFTSRENTCFQVTVLRDHLKLAFDILIDVLLNSEFDSEEIGRERNVVLQEIAMVDESPEERLYDLFFEKFYRGSGLARPILGSHRSVSNFNRKKLIKFFQEHYSPDQLVVAVSGHISHAEVMKCLEPLRSNQWPGRRKKSQKKRKSKKTSLKATKVRSLAMPFKPAWVKDDSEQVHLLVGFEGPCQKSSDRLVTQLLNLHLGGGMSSLLFQEVREKLGLAYTVYSNFSAYEDTGLLAVYAAVKPDQVKLCEQAMVGCLKRLAFRGVSAADLQRLKDCLKGSARLSFENTESRMINAATTELYLGKYYSLSMVCDAIDEIKREDLIRVARTVLLTSRPSVLLLGPRPRGSKPPVFDLMT